MMWIGAAKLTTIGVGESKMRRNRKPTEPFGYIAFGRDGSVRKHVEILSDQKAEQEIEVGQRFAAGLRQKFGKEFDVHPLEEDGHDFILRSADGNAVIVQATEIVWRDYLRPLAVDDYVHGRHSFTEFVCEGPEKIYGVDGAATSGFG